MCAGKKHKIFEMTFPSFPRKQTLEDRKLQNAEINSDHTQITEFHFLFLCILRRKNIVTTSKSCTFFLTKGNSFAF